jgi:Asp/Glu/hydantoin racemase
MSNGATSKAYNGILQGSLRTIKQTHRRLHVVTGTAATPTALMSRIELYGILLGEVAGIRSNLVDYLTCTRAEGQIPVQMECLNRKSLQEGSSP